MAMFMGTTKVVITHFDFEPKRGEEEIWFYFWASDLLMANQWGLSLYGKCYISIYN